MVNVWESIKTRGRDEAHGARVRTWGLVVHLTKTAIICQFAFKINRTGKEKTTRNDRAIKLQKTMVYLNSDSRENNALRLKFTIN
jgi:hypothetical protein